jgi:hypothetical protein
MLKNDQMKVLYLGLLSFIHDSKPKTMAYLWGNFKDQSQLKSSTHLLV